MVPTNRRSLLAAGGTLAALLAGCSGNADSPSGERTGATKADATNGTTATDARRSGTETTGRSGGGTTGRSGGETTDSGPAVDRKGGSDPGEVRWRFDAEGEVGVALAGERVYAAGRRLHAFSEGRRQWSYDPDVPVRSGPVAGPDGAYVFAGADDGGAHPSDATLLAVSSDGERRWRREMDYANRPHDLTVRDGGLFFGTADDVMEPTGERLYAVDAGDGSDRWSAEVGDRPRLWVGDDRVFAAHPWKEGDGVVVGFDRADGTELWRVRRPGPSVPVVGVDDGTIYVAGDGVEAIDGATGEVRWTFDPEGLAPGWGTIAGGRIYVESGFVDADGGAVHAVDPGDGTELWRAELADPVPTPVGVAGGTVFAVSTRAHGFDAAEGTHRWESDELSRYPTSRVARRGLYVRYDDRNRVVSFAPDGSVRWRFAPDGGVNDLALGDGSAYVGGGSGGVYALVA